MILLSDCLNAVESAREHLENIANPTGLPPVRKKPAFGLRPQKSQTYIQFKENRQGFSVIQLPRGIAPFLSINTNKCLQTYVWRDILDV